jgi:hypothetical protein
MRRFLVATLLLACPQFVRGQAPGDRVRLQLAGLRTVVDTIDRWSPDSLQLRSGAAIDRNLILRADVWRPKSFSRTMLHVGTWSSAVLMAAVGLAVYTNAIHFRGSPLTPVGASYGLGFSIGAAVASWERSQDAREWVPVSRLAKW